MRHVNVGGIDDEVLAAAADKTDVYLVRKVWKRSRKSKRAWKLKRLATEREEGYVGDSAKEARDMEEFMQDPEEDPVLRKDVNLYRDARRERILQVRREMEQALAARAQ